jgi:putative membrane protein
MSSFGDWDHGDMMNGNDGGMMDGGGAWVMLFLGLGLVALVVAVVIWMVRTTGPQTYGGGAAGPSVPPSTTARDVLDLRLARGEISPEEYAVARPLLER